jgi:hypothetical protein
MAKVTFAEAKQILVTRWLNEKESGYEASAFGDSLDSHDSITGVIITQVVSKRARFFFFEYMDVTKFSVGKLWINDQRIGAKTNKNWVLHVFGRDKLEALRELAEEMAQTFGVDVHIRLETEEATKCYMPLP